MMHIAICDDQPMALATVAAYTKEYMETHCIDAEIWPFTHPDVLLNACETQRFSLYILDIVMPMISGIEVGREIRRLDREAQILFATSEPGFALDAYAANPINYLLKPMDKDRFFDTLSLVISKAAKAEESTITLKTHDGLRVVRLFTVVCCEYMRRAAQYTLAGSETLTTRTLQGSFADHVAPLLRDKRFLQSHSAFVLNMSRVERFAKNGFTMRGGLLVPISTKQYGAVRDAYMDYLLSQENVKS